MADLIEAALAKYVPVQRIAYGDGIKQEISEHYGLMKGDLGWRKCAHSHGAMRRDENPNYWIKHLNARITTIRTSGVSVIVDDLRLIPEYEDLVQQNFLLVRLNAPARLRAQRIESSGGEPEVAYSTLINECALDQSNFDVVINNDEQCSHKTLDLLARTLVKEYR